MKITMDNFCQFINNTYDWDGEKHVGLWIKPSNMDISGGKITKEEIDELDQYTSIETLKITGLRQDTFEYFIKKYGYKVRAIYFFKNKFVEDWSLLGTLPQLEFVYWFHNQRITKLWDMSNNIYLKGICLHDFTKLKELSGIEKAKQLEFFSMGDAVWPTTKISSYQPFQKSSVKYLEFGGEKIEDENLSFLQDMPNIERFDFVPHLISTEKIAWVMSNFPHIQGIAFHMFIEDYMYNKKTDEYDIPALCLTGKGKRKFRADNLQKQEELKNEFHQLLEQYRDKQYDDLFYKI